MKMTLPDLWRRDSGSSRPPALALMATLLLAAFGLQPALTVGQSQPDATAPSGTLIEVRPGDTFSRIAARFTGDARRWRQLYDAQRSGLHDPNLIQAGTQLELVKNDNGTSYLRVAGRSHAGKPRAEIASADTAPARKPVPAPAAAAKPAAKPPAAVAQQPGTPESDTLVLGVLPNINATTLMSQYENMKRYLERATGKTVRVVTSPNFRAFFESTMRGDFDVTVTGVHMARVNQLDGGLIPIGLYEPRIRALFILPVDKPISSPQELRGKAVAFANPQSLVAMYGLQWLGQQNLQPGKDFEVKAARSDLSVGRLILSGEAAAAIMSNGEFRQLPQEESSRLKIANEFARIPNFVVMAHPRLGPNRISQLKSQLKVFLADKESGAPFASATGVTDIVDADDAVMRELDPYVDQTRRAMGTAK